MRSKPDHDDVIDGGCPDGFWYRPNCDYAARIGLCRFTKIVDNRPSDLGHVTQAVLGRDRESEGSHGQPEQDQGDVLGE